jgi:hypothetical protein
MAFELTLEADPRLARAQAATILETCGANLIEQPNDRKLLAHFPRSGMSVFFNELAPNNAAVAAEGMEYATWPVGSRMVFRYAAANYDLCESDVQAFVEKLADTTNVYFVLSFQFETIRALRDANGLRFVEWPTTGTKPG